MHFYRSMLINKNINVYYLKIMKDYCKKIPVIGRLPICPLNLNLIMILIIFTLEFFILFF